MRSLFWIEAYGVPTRYREVVLTLSKHERVVGEQRTIDTHIP